MPAAHPPVDKQHMPMNVTGRVADQVDSALAADFWPRHFSVGRMQAHPLFELRVLFDDRRQRSTDEAGRESIDTNAMRSESYAK